MKKIIFMLTLLLSLSLFACNKTPIRDKELSDPNNTYYLTSEESYWTASKDNKLSAISLDNNMVKDLKLNESNIKYLYYGYVNLKANANFFVDHLGKKVNGGLSFEIVTTDKPENLSTYYKLTSNGDKYESLTSKYLYDFDEDNYYNGCVAKNEGSYIVIFACYEKTKSFNYGVALIPYEPEDTKTPTPSEKTPTPTPTPTEKPSETPIVKEYSDKLLTNGDFTYHTVGGFVMDWEPTKTNTMTAASIKDISLYSTSVADYLTAKNTLYAKNDKDGIKALFLIENYELNNQPLNESLAPALVPDGKGGTTLVALNQGYALKCIRAYYDDIDKTYINDRWISDPKFAHAETLTPDTLFMPKWVEIPAKGEEHLGKWDDNPVCISGPGLYTVVIVEYNVVGNATTPGFGIALFKTKELDEKTEADIPTKPETPTTTYTITFDNMGYGNSPSDLTGLETIPSSLPKLTHNGYEFGGWYLDEACTDQVKVGVTLTSNITLYAKWTEKVVDPDNIYDGDDILPSSNLASNVQDGLILHAWNWSYKSIEENLEQIARSGYTTVQVSPVQQPKDYSPSYPKGWASQWWKFYQPLSFSVAQTSWLGTKRDLISLCNSADKYGIKIIADIVANHTANISDVGTSNQSTPHSTVGDYEKELYNNRKSYFRSFITNNDSSIEAVVRGSIGMPDLKTETEFVQNMVIDLLKECIDCGIDGFRFDAAKHIETPDDGSYASNFWPNVINTATTYAKTKGIDLYCYGEILNTCGNGRNFSSYTKYMSITDNTTGDNIRRAIVSKNASNAANSSYNTGQDANKLVLWAESHDTYANDTQESTNVSQANINKTWALVASRKDATALYFARPGEVGSIGTWDWMSNEVSSVNNFHNEFIGANESLYYSGNYAIVERYNTSSCGLVIVNCNGNAGSVSFDIKNIKDGQYIDQITGNKFTVLNGKITGNIGSSGIAVIYNNTKNAPIATLSQAGGYFDSTLTININLSFATSARIKYGNEEKIITKNDSITIGSNMKNGESIEVEVVAINDDYRQTKTYTFIKLSGVTNKSVVVSEVPERYASGSTYDVYAWVWKTGQSGRLVKTNLNGTYIVFDVNDGENNFLLLTVGKSTQGITKDNVWNFAVKQTSDFIISENAIYTAPDSVWKNS